MMGDKLSRIIYMSLPEGLSLELESFSLDLSTLIPVEIPEGVPIETWSLRDLRWEMVVAGMLKVITYDPDNPDAPYFRKFIRALQPNILAELNSSGAIKARQGNYLLAEEIFCSLQALAPGDLLSKLNLALLYESQMAEGETKSELLERVKQLYQDLVPQGKELPQIYFNAAWFYFSHQTIDEALVLIEQYLACPLKEEKKTEALKMQERWQQCQRDNQRYHLALELIQEGEDQEGLEEIENFLVENPTAWNAWFLKGWALRRLMRFEEALKAFLGAEELIGQQVDILNEKAICYLELGQYHQSQKALEEALALAPGDSKILSNMGILQLKQGQRARALEIFKAVLRLEPGDPIASEYVAFIEGSS